MPNWGGFRKTMTAGAMNMHTMNVHTMNMQTVDMHVLLHAYRKLEVSKSNTQGHFSLSDVRYLAFAWMLVRFV